MLCFHRRNLILNWPYYLNVRSIASSVLAQSTDDNSIYHILNPFIDFDERIKHSHLQDSIEKRNLKINLEHLIELWEEFKNIKEDRIRLESSKIDIQKKIRSLPVSEKNQIDGLKLAGKIVRQDLKNISHTLSDLEKNLLPRVIKLPNDVLDNIYPKKIEVYAKPKLCLTNHIELGKQLGLFDYISPTTYFLKEEAANFELSVSFDVSKIFVDNGFIPFSNPDFSRNVIVEGICDCSESLLKLDKDTKSDDIFLNGSASFHPFCSYHTKTISSKIPIKYVTNGRQYRVNDLENGLYTVWQSTAVQIFIATSKSEVLEEFNKTVKLVAKIYLDAGLHFRILRLPPSELQLHEALRLSFQVHSPFKNTYYEVGNLSFYGDYISKRLRMYYKDEDNSISFLHVISGTILKVPPLLASILEHNENRKFPLREWNLKVT